MAEKTSYKISHILFLIFLVGLLARIVFILLLGPHFYFDDEQEYWKMVNNFLSGKGLMVSETLKAYRPPVYPLFIAILVKLGSGIVGIRIVQALISAVTSVLIYLLGRKVFSERVAILAGCISSVYPFFIFYTGFLLTETLFIFLMVSAILMFIRVFESDTSPLYGTIPGFITGIAGLCRPTMEAFFPFALVFILFSEGSYKKRLLKIFFAGLGFILILSPWVIRNFVVLGKFIPGTTMGGAVFWEGNNPYSEGGPCRYFPDGVWQIDESKRDSIFYKITIDYIKQDPVRFIKLLGKKFVRFWNVVLNASDYSSFFYRLVSVLSFGLLLPFFVIGLFIPPLDLKKAFLIGIIVFFTIFHMIFLASVRYRIAIEPFVILFACQGFFWFLEHVKGIVNK
ncbi:MAG TPA: glycosyltransferase family 39 protein [bacterium]|mgnify:FL=1|nr:glycosyltransferase family 39 protein [bacterium]